MKYCSKINIIPVVFQAVTRPERRRVYLRNRGAYAFILCDFLAVCDILYDWAAASRSVLFDTAADHPWLDSGGHLGNVCFESV